MPVIVDNSRRLSTICFWSLIIVFGIILVIIGQLVYQQPYTEIHNRIIEQQEQILSSSNVTTMCLGTPCVKSVYNLGTIWNSQPYIYIILQFQCIVV